MRLKSLLFVFTTYIFITTTAYAKIDLTIDRNDIRVNETFQLTLNVEDPKTLASQQSMDFLPNEFRVLGSQHFQKSTVIDRQFANQMGWTITLIATQAGTYTIPAFTIGTEQSEAITIRILPALSNIEELNPNSKIKLTARISEEEVYVQQQIIYSVRIYSSVPSRRHSISPLHVDNAIVKKLGEAAEFQMVSQGVQYNVKEEKYVIFPQKSGALSIPPIQFRTNIVDTQASFGSLSRYRPIELSAKPFTVTVKARAESAELPWIPAKDLNLSAEWQTDPKAFEVGKPATLDFYIKGVGLLPEQLPTIEFPEVDGLKIYRDKPVLQSRINAYGVNSYHLEKLAVIPNKAGEVTIPAIKIPYWDTTKDQQAYAELAPISVSIGEPTNTVALPAISNQPSIQPQHVITGQSNQAENPLWQYLTFSFAALWLITLGVYFFRGAKPEKLQKNHKEPKHTQKQTNLNQALKSSEPKIFAQATIDWFNQSSNEKLSNLNQLISYCDDNELKHELQKLQSVLYSPSSTKVNDWDGIKIRKLLQAIKFADENKATANKVPPLYPE